MEIINVTDEIIEINVTEAVVNVVTQNGAYPLPSNVFSVFGRTGNVVGQAGDYTTSIVAEGTNLYYTQARFNTAFGNKTTTDLAEGTNLYYTDARSRSAISENITGLEYSSASGIFSLASGYLIPTQAMLDAKVPYTGATGNVTLGEYQLSAGQVTFDQTPTGTAGVGVLRWNNTDGTLDLGLKGGAVTLQIGQEQVKRVVNGAGINLTEAAYQVVRVSGAQGQRLQVVLAQANNDQNSATTLGIVTENINNNQEGFITTSGEVRDINTTGSLQGETWADGDVLYLSPTTAGRITNIKPVAPNHMVIVGYVEYAHQNNGKIFVKVDNGYELDELHNVKITDPLNNQALIFDSTDSVWKNESIASAIGYTPANAATLISTTAPLTGGGDLSANRTLSMPAATTSANGYLTSTDWNTFNNKENFLASGTTAQYYRGDKTFQTLNTTAVAEGTNLYYTQARFDTAFGNKSTTNLTEGTNLYYTDARARAAITGTAPISVTSGVVSISQAGGAANGFLSSTDWNTFNNKQAALNGTGFVKISGTTISYDNNTYLTTISGIAAGGELSGTYANPTLVNSAVIGKVLTGLNLTGGGTISDTDSILGAFGKVQNQISALVGGVMYEGTWNASTNTPTIVSSVGSKGDYYIVATAGSTNINGITSWNVGDWIIFNGTTWDKVDNTDAVSSVNGYTGAVSLVTSDVPESGSLYFTNARAIGSTLTGYTSGSGVVAATDTILQAIQKLNGNVSGLVTGVSSVFGRTGAVVAASGDYTTTQVTEGTNLYYTEGRVSANTDVAANTAARHAAVTIGTANGLSLSTQALSLAAASTSTTGALTSTDWNTFNGKQAALNGTGFVKISGTTISYDNSTYLTTSAASSTYLPLAGGTLTGALGGTSATFSGDVIRTSSNVAGINEIAVINSATSGASSSRLRISAAFTGATTLGDAYTQYTDNNNFNWSTGAGVTTSRDFVIANHFTLGTNVFLRLTSAGVLTINGGAALARINLGYNFYIENDQSPEITSFVNSSGTSIFRWLQQGSNERMRISSGGNLLVGTNSDNGRRLRVSTSSADYAAQISQLGSSGGSHGLTIDCNSSSSSNIGLEIYSSSASVFKTRLFTDGSATFSSSITAAGATFSGTTAVASVGGTSQMRIDRSGAIARIQNYDSGSAANISLAYDGGNVGIGTTSPLSLLQVGAFSSNNAITIGAATTGVSSLYFGDGSGAALYRGFIEYQHNEDYMRIGTSATERMRITSGGNVLIGTTTDAGYILEVNGTARATNLRATTDLYLDRTGVAPAIVLNQSSIRLVDAAGSSSVTIKSINNNFEVSGAIINSGNLITQKSSGGGSFKQVVVGQKTAASSGVSMKIAYVGFTHAVRVYVWANQSTGNGATAVADFTTMYGSSNGGVTYSSTLGNVSAISISYDNGGSPAYTINVTLTYSGAAPTINFVVEGINNDNNIYVVN